MKMKFFSLVLFLIASTISLVFGQDFWTGLNGPFGGDVRDVAYTSSGTLLAATNGGLFRSIDGGNSWVRIESGLDQFDTSFMDIEIDASDKIHLITYSALYTSTTDGASWVKATVTNFNDGRIIKIASDGDIYLATSNDILRSSNGGASFAGTLYPVGNFITGLEVTSSEVIYVARHFQSIQKGGSNGISWQDTALSPFSGFPTLSNHNYRIALDDASPNNLYVLTDVGPYKISSTGTSWSLAKTGLAETNYYGNIFHSSGDLYLFNNDVNQMFVSINGATSWGAGQSYPVSGAEMVAFTRKSSTELFVVPSTYGVYASTNSGAGWSLKSEGIKATNPRSIIITPNENRLLLATNDRGFQISLDDGNSWDLLSSGPTDRFIQGTLQLTDNSIVAYGDGIIRSTNDGDSWSIQNTNGYFNPMAANGTDLYTVIGTDLHKSTNLGVSWLTTSISGLTGNYYDKIFVDSNGDTYVRDSGTNRVFKILNGSSSSTQLSPNAMDFTLVGNTLLVLTFSNTIEKSTDGGSIFTTTNIPPSFASSRIWAYSENDIFLMSNQNGKLNISADGGSTWISRNLDDNNAFINDLQWVEKPQPGGIGVDLFLYLAPNSSVVHKSTNGVILPEAPTNLTLSGLTYNQIYFEWDFASVAETEGYNTESFEVEVSEGNNFSWEEARVINFASPNIQGKLDWVVSATPETQTYIRISATNSAGRSPYSNELLVNVPAKCISDIPDNRSWTAVATADPGSTAPGGAGPFTSVAASVKLRAGTENTFTVEDFLLGIDNDNRSVTIDENCGESYFAGSGNYMPNGNGTWDPVLKKLTLKWKANGYLDPFEGTTVYTLNASDPVPDAPEMQVYLYSGTEVLVNWSQTNFTNAFVLERSTTPGSGFVEIASTNYPTIFYLDKNLVTGNTYYYRLKGRNAFGDSPYSSEEAITTQAALFRPVENDISLNFENQQGVSWGDLDGDGLEDIASPSFTNSNGDAVPPVFFRNLGNGAFERKDIAVLADENTGVSRGINIMDFNNDDKLDMYITRSGGGLTDLLLINNGNWNFTKTIVPSTGNYITAFRSSVALDFDNDGFVDIFTGQDRNSVTEPLRDILFRNAQGSGFTEVTSGELVTLEGNSRNVNNVDYNNDGFTDLFVVDYRTPGSIKLFENNGDGTFTKVTGSVFNQDIFYSIRSTSWGDIDNDGDMDVFMGSAINNPITPNVLLRNNGDGSFTNLTSSTVAESTGRTFGSAFGDLDNDGDLDLIAVNGSSLDNSNSIFFNNGNGTFTKYAGLEMITHPEIDNIGVALADFDQDGFLDIYPAKGITSTVDLPNLLYRNSQTNSGSRNWIEIKLVGTESNRAAIGARIKVTTNTPARSQIREVSTRTGYGSANSLIAHFGLASASIANEIEIKWPSGNVMVLNDLPINQIHTIIEDVTGPTFTFSPAANSTAAPIGNTIDVILNESATAVAGKFVTIRKGSESSTPIQTIAVAAGTITGTTYTYTLNASTEYETQYFISIDAGAYLDQYQNGSLAVAATSWSFTTSEPPDLTFPVITFNPNDYVSLPKGFGTQEKLVALASDNKAVTSFSMFYRKVTATQFSQVFGTLTGSNTYEFPLLESFFDDMGMEFYLEAKDAADNTTLEPATGYHSINLAFDDSNTTLSIPSGSSVNSYVIGSLPYEGLPSNEISVLFDELGQPDITQYRVLRYQNSPEAWLEYPASFNSIVRGNGYFILSRKGANVKFGNATSPSNRQGNLFELSLIAGWNLIGNPYTVTASWEESIAGLTGVGKLKVYQSGSYVEGNEIPIFGGGFVFADAPQVVPVKFKTSLTGGRIKRNEFTSELDKENWLVPFELEQAGSKFLFGGIGMHPESKLSYDDYDDLNPPALEDRLELKFRHPEHFMKGFSRDMVPTSNDFEWEFDVISDKVGQATLNWDPSLFGENAKELMLYDQVLQRVIDMRDAERYVFDPEISNHFKIYFGENLKEKVKPSGVSLGYPTPNPTQKLSSISFTLSNETPIYQVNLEVYDMMGRRVESLVNGKLTAGFYKYQWDTSNKEVTDGLYTYRLAISANGKHDIQTRKVVVKK